MIMYTLRDALEKTREIRELITVGDVETYHEIEANISSLEGKIQRELEWREKAAMKERNGSDDTSAT